MKYLCLLGYEMNNKSCVKSHLNKGREEHKMPTSLNNNLERAINPNFNLAFTWTSEYPKLNLFYPLENKPLEKHQQISYSTISDNPIYSKWNINVCKMSPRFRCKKEIGKLAQANETGKVKTKNSRSDRIQLYACRSRFGSTGWCKYRRGINPNVTLPDLKTNAE